MAQAPLIIGLASLAIGAYQAHSTYQAQQDAKEEQDKANKAARALAEANALRSEAETAEELRRANKTKEKEAGTLRARLAASGVSGMSAEAYISDFLSERTKEIEWISKSGESQAKSIRQGVSYQSSLSGGNLAQMFGGLVSTAASGYEWYDKYIKSP